MKMNARGLSVEGGGHHPLTIRAYLKKPLLKNMAHQKNLCTKKQQATINQDS